jgi:hypothetical protein
MLVTAASLLASCSPSDEQEAKDALNKNLSNELITKDGITCGQWGEPIL